MAIAMKGRERGGSAQRSGSGSAAAPYTQAERLESSTTSDYAPQQKRHRHRRVAAETEAEGEVHKVATDSFRSSDVALGRGVGIGIGTESPREQKQGHARGEWGVIDRDVGGGRSGRQGMLGRAVPRMQVQVPATVAV